MKTHHGGSSKSTMETKRKRTTVLSSTERVNSERQRLQQRPLLL
jgi:hypothetical protein